MSIQYPKVHPPQLAAGLSPCNASGRFYHRVAWSLLALTDLAIGSAHGATGALQLSGTLSTQTCSVAAAGAATGSGGSITLDFERVPIAELQPFDIWVPSHGKNFTLIITCTGLPNPNTQARANFYPASGSGLDPNDSRLLKLDAQSTARGVGVALWDPNAATPLNLSENPPLFGLFSAVGANHVATISIAALYARTSANTSGGTANAALPFLLSYE